MIKVNELFSGIGAFRKALERLNIPHEIVGISEIDKHAIKSYEAIFGVTRNYGDISKIDKLDYADMWTYGFPCQDISISGLQGGIVKNKTRSGLLYEVQRLLITAALYDELPKYLILENVKNLIGKRFINDFNSWLEWLECIGYNNYWEVTNAKDFGVPQNRERVFVVSIRKDIDDKSFEFPKKLPLAKTLREVMETEVDEKYFLDDKYEYVLKVNDNYSLLYGGTIGKMTDIYRRVYNPDYVSPTIHTCPGGNTQPRVFDPCVIGGVGEKKSNDGGQWYQQDRIYDDRVSISVTTSANPYYIDTLQGRPRKLTPRECWRLMSFGDDDFDKVEKICSPRQLYKQAGNSIVVKVVESILNNLLLGGANDRTKNHYT